MQDLTPPYTLTNIWNKHDEKATISYRFLIRFIVRES